MANVYKFCRFQLVSTCSFPPTPHKSRPALRITICPVDHLSGCTPQRQRLGAQSLLPLPLPWPWPTSPTSHGRMRAKAKPSGCIGLLDSIPNSVARIHMVLHRRRRRRRRRFANLQCVRYLVSRCPQHIQHPISPTCLLAFNLPLQPPLSIDLCGILPTLSTLPLIRPQS